MDCEVILEDAILIGNYITFYVSTDLEEKYTPNLQSKPNAFTILMNKDKTSLPAREQNAMNNKNLDLIGSNQINFSSGEELVAALTDTFWYVDDIHKTLNDRSHSVPDMFLQFSGYNKPEVHKHNRKTTENMQSSNLKTHSDLLFRICGTTYMKSANWSHVVQHCDTSHLREILLRMADNLRKHVHYLDDKNQDVSERQQKIPRTDKYQ